MGQFEHFLSILGFPKHNFSFMKNKKNRLTSLNSLHLLACFPGLGKVKCVSDTEQSTKCENVPIPVLHLSHPFTHTYIYIYIATVFCN